jgi:hypothetical protein
MARKTKAQKQQEEEARARKKAIEERDWMVRKLVYQYEHCHRSLLGPLPPALVEAAYTSFPARGVLDDWLLEHGIDVMELSDLISEADYLQPYGLSEAGRRAHRIILDFLKKRGLLYSGGTCNVFRTPDEWERHENTELPGVELVVIYDGGSHNIAFNSSYEDPEFSTALAAQLEAEGLYLQPINHWSSAVHRLE